MRIDDWERELWITAAGAAGYLSLSDWARDALNGRARLAPMLSSSEMGWNTPEEVLAPLRRALGDVRLDPCSNDRSIVRACCALDGSPGRDGLAVSWDDPPGCGTCAAGWVFVNPPYGPAIPDWIAKCALEARAGSEIVALVPARTDTQWWDLAVGSCTAFVLWRGRVTFLGAASTAPFPVALFYWGPAWRAFTRGLSPHGRVFSGGAG